jgi:ParB family transcriptional regulator, chromosome partitioning protein
MNQAPKPQSAARKPTASPVADPSHGSVVETIQIGLISVEESANPRRRLRGIDELAASIRDHGLLQPLVVRRNKSRGYVLIAGHRRLAALKKLAAEPGVGNSWLQVPVVIREEDADQAYVLTLVENLQRADLSATEESEALGHLVREHSWTTRRVAAAINRSQAHVSRRLRVYEDRALRRFVLDRRLTISVAEELLAADDDARAALARQAVRERWDQKRARGEARGHQAVVQPALRRQIRALRETVANTSLSASEQSQLRQLADFLLEKLPP